MTVIETQHGFAVCERADKSVFYLCLHEDCEEVAWGTSEFDQLLKHRKSHSSGKWKIRRREDFTHS